MAIVGFFFCLLQLLSPCMPFSLGARRDTLKGGIINWCMFFLTQGLTQNHTIAATTFFYISSVLYATEVAWVCFWPGDMYCFVPTLPDMLRRLENYVACVIFAFISSPYLYQDQ
ncbi:Myeloid-associated differentiation marker [Camelus dromedarius]|uniref:Myeloid-associated differentiation marker n=1 Tax=Camelus dromedarius TaxID=9838 RepID=A0A5N4CDS0_CAMDR|nr:Myeloid-associated differentiation marker [Camelus dromedarius]